MCVKVQNRCPEEMTYPQFPQGNPPSQLSSNLYRREKGICYRTQNADRDTGAKGQALNLVSRKSWQEELPVSTISRSPFLRPWSRYQPENGVKYSHLTKRILVSGTCHIEDLASSIAPTLVLWAFLALCNLGSSKEIWCQDQVNDQGPECLFCSPNRPRTQCPRGGFVHSCYVKAPIYH